MERRPAELAFLSGLLQDVGILAMLHSVPKIITPFSTAGGRSGPLKLAMIERSELGCTHAEVSAAMLERWQLPASLIVPVLHHLEPRQDAARLGIDPDLHRVMMIGEAIADLVDAPHASRRHTLDSLLAHYGPGEQSACRKTLIRATSKATEASRSSTSTSPPPPS